MTNDNARDSIRRLRTVVGGTLLLGGVAILPGCGGGSTSGPNQVVQAPRAPVRNVIAEETFTGLAPDAAQTVALVAFSTAVVGDLDITVDWTFASNDVDFILVSGTLEQALTPECQGDSPDCPLTLVASALTVSKPEVITVANAAAGNYVVAVANFGTTAESGVVVVGLTTAAASSPPSVAATRSIITSSLGRYLTGVR